MLIKLAKLENKAVLDNAVDAILALARHTKDMFVNTMLNQTIPFHSYVILDHFKNQCGMFVSAEKGRVEIRHYRSIVLRNLIQFVEVL